MRAKDALGLMGEDLAAKHLAGAGLVVIERNWRCREGEIDILARDGDVLVVCEVKTRSSIAYGTPAEAVNYRKAARLRRRAALWLQGATDHFESIRFDVIAVLRQADGSYDLQHLVGVLS